jgi:hypothetical protein
MTKSREDEWPTHNGTWSDRTFLLTIIKEQCRWLVLILLVNLNNGGQYTMW